MVTTEETLTTVTLNSELAAEASDMSDVSDVETPLADSAELVVMVTSTLT